MDGESGKVKHGGGGLSLWSVVFTALLMLVVGVAVGFVIGIIWGNEILENDKDDKNNKKCVTVCNCPVIDGNNNQNNNNNNNGNGGRQGKEE